MKKQVPSRMSGVGIKKRIPSASGRVIPDANLSIERDCMCETMQPHCPVPGHATRRIPAPGQDVIR